MMKIYLAAPWEDKIIAQNAAEKFREAEFEITSQWLTSEETDDPDTLKAHALRDINDLLDSNMLVLLNTQERGYETSGKAVETGIAIAWLKPIIMVGNPTNVFHYLNIPKVDTVDEAIEEAKRWIPTYTIDEFEVVTAVRKKPDYKDYVESDCGKALTEWDPNKSGDLIIK